MIKLLWSLFILFMFICLALGMTKNMLTTGHVFGEPKVRIEIVAQPLTEADKELQP